MCGSVHLCCLIDWKDHSWLNRSFGGLITGLQSPLYLLYFLCFLTSVFFSLERTSAHWMHHTDFTCFHCSILTKSHDDCTLERFVVEIRKLIVHYCQPSLSLILPAFCSTNRNLKIVKANQCRPVWMIVSDGLWGIKFQITHQPFICSYMMPMVI